MSRSLKCKYLLDEFFEGTQHALLCFSTGFNEQHMIFASKSQAFISRYFSAFLFCERQRVIVRFANLLNMTYRRLCIQMA